MIESGQQTVGTTRVRVDGNHNNPSVIYVHNNDNTDDLLIGGSDVTTSNGLILKKEETVRFELNPLEELFVISTKAGHSISYLRQAD